MGPIGRQRRRAEAPRPVHRRRPRPRASCRRRFPASREFTAALAAHLREALREAPPPLSAERIAAIQAECYADDVDVPSGASGWTEAALREYFESGGQSTPN